MLKAKRGKDTIAERVRSLSPEKRALLEKLTEAGESEHLAKLLRQGASFRPGSPLVPIQPAGLKPPFFCVPPVFGTTFLYYDLARHLGSNQPFYGLQPFGIDGQGAPHFRIEDMATHYIDALRALQPEGPYLLGGYSFGGVVAFEMAQQLRKAGHSVGCLALLDTWVPIAVSKPSFRDTLAFFIAATLGIWPYIYDYFTLITAVSPQGIGKAKKLPIFSTAFSWLRADRPLHRLVRKFGTRSIARHGDKPLMFNQPTIRPMLQVLTANIQAVRSYMPQIYPNRITLFRTGAPSAKGHQDPTMGWRKLTTAEVEVHRVPGAHLSIMREPHVRGLAEELRACFDRSRQTAD